MSNPFRIEGPAVISFSGGRTSGFMLYKIIEAHGGKLPDDVHVTFANTGKEMPQTLDFVHECGQRFGAEISWLEYDPTQAHNTRVVDYATAAQNGEPFHELIKKKQFLPNAVVRFCTIELKIKRIEAFMREIKGYETWTNIVGLRADEADRVVKLVSAKKEEMTGYKSVAPLHTAGITKHDVVRFWDAQPFNLNLPSVNGTTPLGNCDGCMLKGFKLLRRIAHDHPDRIQWWADQEAFIGKMKNKPDGLAAFHNKRETYTAMLENARNGTPAGRGMATDEEMGEEARIDCTCTD